MESAKQSDQLKAFKEKFIDAATKFSSYQFLSY